ncbi:MAG: hypothetical protein L0Z55_01845 [Planctomycetes bacterium]|nr:hypothetical protein [Planctomycetota bacterium]
MKRRTANRCIVLVVLLAAWGIVLWRQFGGAEAAAQLPAGAPIAPPPLPRPGDTERAAPPSPGGSGASHVASAAVAEAQRAASKLPWHRNPFERVWRELPITGVDEAPRGGGPEDLAGRGAPALTAILGRWAVVGGKRYAVGDEIPGIGRLTKIEFDHVEVELNGVAKRIFVLRPPRQAPASGERGKN